MSMEWASRKTKTNSLLQKNTVPLFNNLGKIAIGIFGAYFIFLSWDININGILASAGVLGVVLGLAAKDTVSNFFAGIFLLADAMGVVDKFGTDARSINRTLESIKDPEQVEKAVQTDNVEKFVDKQRQIKN